MHAEHPANDTDSEEDDIMLMWSDDEVEQSQQKNLDRLIETYLHLNLDKEDRPLEHAVDKIKKIYNENF